MLKEERKKSSKRVRPRRSFLPFLFRFVWGLGFGIWSFSMEREQLPQLFLVRLPPVLADLERLGVGHLRGLLARVPLGRLPAEALGDAAEAGGLAVAHLRDPLLA